MVGPGITGWAQVRYKYGNTIEDAKEKLQYDLFYIKNAVAGPGHADHVPDHQDRAAGPGRAMKWVFWISAALIVYTYVGYPVWLWLRSRWRPRPVRRGALSAICLRS